MLFVVPIIILKSVKGDLMWCPEQNKRTPVIFAVFLIAE
jgi:hypothetical protein